MIVGTAGHVDHGKTSLVRALTGVETDRLKEEKARGISIDLGFAYLPTPEGGRLGFVDVPGHERFVHTMLAGASGIDFALLAVAADDGPMPQTAEHLAILDLLGIERGVVALTKVDTVDEGRLEEAEAEVRSALAGTALAHADILPVSSLSGVGIGPLRARLFAEAARHGARSTDRAFRLAVDRSFTLAGAGTVVTGTVLSGQVVVGDRVLLSPAGTPARVRGIHVQNEPAQEGKAGDRCALNIAGEGIGRESARRGDVVLDPALHAPTVRIDAELRLLGTEPKAIGTWTPAFLHHAAREVAVRIVPLGEEPLAPGETGLAQLVLEEPIAAAAGDRFVLRDPSQQRTMGGGRFLDLRAPSRKRRSPERLRQLDALGLHHDAAVLAGLLDAPPHYVDLGTFLRDRALRPEAASAMTERLALIRIPAGNSASAMSAPSWLRLRRALGSFLTEYHATNPDLMGIGIERLRTSIDPRLPASVFRPALAMLAASRDVSIEGAWVRLPGHTVRLSSEDERRWDAVAPLLGHGERFRPPRVRDIAGLLSLPEGDVRRLLKLGGRLGRVDEVAHDHFFLRRTVGEMVDIIVRLAEAAQGGEFTASQFRDQVENGRKVAIQILEFYDRHGVTLRRGDLRRVNRHRLDLFRTSVGPASEEANTPEGEASPVGRPDFKSGRGREPVSGGFDSHSLSPNARSAP